MHQIYDKHISMATNSNFNTCIEFGSLGIQLFFTSLLTH